MAYMFRWPEMTEGDNNFLCLQSLKDHLKSGSRDSASLAVSCHSPALVSSA